MPYIGVPNGQVVFRGFDSAGRASVQTRTTKYTLPAGIREPKAIKAWVVRQVKSGAIGTQLYPKQGEYKPKRVDEALKRVVNTLDSRIVLRRQVVALNSELTKLPGAERAALVKGLAKSPKRLDRWISEAISPGWLGLGPLGGLSPNQRKELFSALVKDQDPENLRTIAKVAGGQGKMNEFVQAVAQEGSREQRQGLFIRLAEDAQTGAKDAVRSRAVLYKTLGKPKVEFDGRDAAGNVQVRMLGSRSTLPSRAKDPDLAIKRWVGSVDTGGIAKSTALPSRGRAPDVEIKSRVGKVEPGGIANPTAPTGKAYDSRKVSAAYQIFEKALGGIGFGGRNRAVRLDDEFKALNGAERKALVNLLATRRGGTLLEGWIAAIRGQRNEFYRAIVKGQDPTNLKRIAKVEIKRDKWLQYRWGAGNAGGMSDFMQAVAQHGTWQQRHGLFMSLVDNAKRGTPGAARAMAELFAGLRNRSEVDAAFTALDRPATDAMVAASLVLQSGVTPNPSLYRRMATAAKLSRNATEKASFVAASRPVLIASTAPNRKTGVQSEVLKAMSGVIETDVGGVIDSTLNQFNNNGCTSGRDSLSKYVEGLIDTERFEDFKMVVQSLKRGPGGRVDPMSWLAVKSARNGEEPTYHHARILGTYLGVVSGVVLKRDGFRSKKATEQYVLWSFAIGFAKETLNAFLPKGKWLVGVGSEGLKGSVAAGLLGWRNSASKGERSLVDALKEAGIPRYEITGAEVTAPWVTTFKAAYGWGAPDIELDPRLPVP